MRVLYSLAIPLLSVFTAFLIGGVVICAFLFFNSSTLSSAYFCMGPPWPIWEALVKASIASSTFPSIE